ncbi:hypothetical protein MSG28_012433 [Choristoneura fumiferana]|uniref:Uncharacterized protein n=2 Tax=Choristoneura fumiferana TaxID=7141 RepID=A0ACC0KDW9_CHOFU|nr:hypothetical protein MSG28_012433 [Choristoneura fumiferana]
MAEVDETLKKKRTFRKFTFRGVDLDQLLDMPNEQLMELMHARARRRFARGLKRKPMALVKKLRRAKKEAPPNEKPEIVKTHLRNMIIVPEMVGSIVGIYNGKTFNQVEIKPEMIGHYLGEFSVTYKPVKHAICLVAFAMWEFQEALEEARVFGPELLHVARHAINSNLDITPYGLRSVPTHTEDGIPIRKLYVANLPPKTTRTELFGVFAQYGFIKSCWLRMGDRGLTKNTTPTYAFVTFSDPADAHKALLAPESEKALRGFKLKTFPADSWHQPAEDADGHVHWKPRAPRRNSATLSPAPELPTNTTQESSNGSGEATSSVAESNAPHGAVTLTTAVLRRVLQRLGPALARLHIDHHWSALNDRTAHTVGKFCPNLEELKHGAVTLTTAVLRRVLQRLGPALARLHIDHHWSALNDRTAHTVGKFCPNLEELKVVGMYTKNWNPLIYGCKNLRALSFVSCNKLSDSNLVRIVKSEASIESVMVANNTHVTGLFLTGSNPPKLHTLSFYNCYSLQGTVLSAAIDTLPNLRTLKLDVCPVTMWKIIPLILSKLPKLEELSLSEYTSIDVCLTPQVGLDFCESMSKLTELKILNLSRNIYITNNVMKQIAKTCSKLEVLNISSCNSRKSNPQPGIFILYVGKILSFSLALAFGRTMITPEVSGGFSLRRLDISYWRVLSDARVRAAPAPPPAGSHRARERRAHRAPFAAVLDACPLLQVTHRPRRPPAGSHRARERRAHRRALRRRAGRVPAAAGNTPARAARLQAPPREGTPRSPPAAFAAVLDACPLLQVTHRPRPPCRLHRARERRAHRRALRRRAGRVPAAAGNTPPAPPACRLSPREGTPRSPPRPSPPAGRVPAAAGTHRPRRPPAGSHRARERRAHRAPFAAVLDACPLLQVTHRPRRPPAGSHARGNAALTAAPSPPCWTRARCCR